MNPLLNPFSSLCRVLLIFAVCLVGGPVSGDSRWHLEVSYVSERLSLHAENAPLNEVLQEIGKRVGIRIVLAEESEATVSARFSNAPLLKAVQQLIDPNTAIEMQYSEDGEKGEHRRLVAMRIHNVRHGQSRTQTPTTRPSRALKPRAIQSSGDNPSNAPGDRESAIREAMMLAGHSDSESIEKLGRMLGSHPDLEVRDLVVYLLSDIGGQSVVTALEQGLGDNETSIRRAVVEALGVIESDGATRSLGQVLYGESDPDIRLLAVTSLARRRDGAAQAFLQAATNDEDDRVRELATQALGN